MQQIIKRFKENINFLIFLLFIVFVGVVSFVSLSEPNGDISSLQNFSPHLYAALVGNTNQATLSVSPDTGSYNPNDSFKINIYVNTHDQNVSAVGAYLNYDKVHFQAVSIDTTGTEFPMEMENTIDSTNGKIKITRGIQNPGLVNKSNALVAAINFKALSGTSPPSDNLTFEFTAGVKALDSDVILKGDVGTDILSGVYNGRYTVAGGSSDTQAPSVPTNLSASAVSSSQINLSWTASTDNVGITGYRIFRNGVQAGTSATNSYNDSGLSPSTTYNYNVSAYDAAGNESGQSSQASATTQSQSDNVTTLSVSLIASPSSGTAPLSGVGLTATVSGGSGNINYTFYCNRSDSGTNVTTPYDAKIDDQTQTSYTASNLCSYSSAGSYTAKVIVERDSSQAEARATVTVTSTQPLPPQNDTTPPVITSISSSLITSNSATISWTTNEAANSQVEFGPTANYGNLSGLNTSLATSHSVLLSNLSPSTAYHYRVKSSDATGNLATSGDYTFTTTAVSLTLSVSLSVSPSSGVAPLSGVDLTASVSGSATGNMNYTFYCNRSDTGLNVTSPYDAKYNDQTGSQKTAGDICSYPSAGSYTAKVIIERGSYQAEARVAVIVNKPAGARPGTGATIDYTPFGFIDSADEDKVVGWVYDQNLGTSPSSVKIFVDDKDIATVIANQDRKDILGAQGGTVKDAFHGFNYNFSGLSSGTHTINIYAINMPGGNLVELGSSPKNITVAGFSDFFRSVLKLILRSPVLFFLALFIIIYVILKMISPI